MSKQKANGNTRIQNAFTALVEHVYCNDSTDSQFTVNALGLHGMNCKMLLLVLNFRFCNIQQDVDMDLGSVSTSVIFLVFQITGNFPEIS